MPKRIKPDQFKQYIEDRIEIIPESGCWIWMGGLRDRRAEYGHATVSGKIYRAHRLSYEVFNGPIPEGLHILHRCDVPSCVNPKHLFIGTHLDNMQDSVRKGRQESKKGSKNGRAILDEEKIHRIFQLHRQGNSNTEIGKIFGVGNYAIWSVITRKSWTHVEIKRGDWVGD